MKRALISMVVVVLALPALSGCVEERVVVRRPAPCPGGVWVAGHYGPRGRWWPEHWRCPGVVEVVERE